MGNEALSAGIHIYVILENDFQQMRTNRVIVAMACWFGCTSLVDILLAFLILYILLSILAIPSTCCGLFLNTVRFNSLVQLHTELGFTEDIGCWIKKVPLLLVL